MQKVAKNAMRDAGLTHTRFARSHAAWTRGCCSASRCLLIQGSLCAQVIIVNFFLIQTTSLHGNVQTYYLYSL